MPTAPFSSNRRTICWAMSVGRAELDRAAGAAPAGLARHLAAEQAFDRRIELLEAGREIVDHLGELGRRRGVAQDVGDVKLERLREAWSNSSRRSCSGIVGGVEQLPEALHVEQALGRDEGGRDLAERGAFLLGQSEGRGDAEPVDEAVGDLGGDDLAAQAMLEDGVAVAFLHRLREGGAQLRGQGRILGDLAGFERRLERHLGGGEQDRELGTGQAAILLGAAHQLLVALEALDGAVEPAAFLEHLDHPDAAAEGRRSAALGDRQRQGLKPIVLEHDRGDLVGHLGEQERCDPRASAGLPPSRG